jgi:hypothetical protein
MRAKHVLVFFLVLMFVLSLMRANTQANARSSREFLSFLIILDQPQYFEELKDWLTDVDFHNFTFAVREEAWYGTDLSSYWLLNSTRLDTLKEYGILIPETYNMQRYEPSERKAVINGIVDEWESVVGYAPKGIFDFQPDTYTVNYCKTKGIQYVVGYCFDQYAVDWMTERGGWQMPYYASPDHVLMPNNASSGGVLVFPHQVWDWVSSFTVSHNLHTHPLSIIDFFDGNASKAKEYVLSLISRSLNAEPFGFVSVQFEWVYHYVYNLQDIVKDWVKTLLSAYNYSFWTYEDFTKWFNKEHETTPDYSINFTSPYDSETIEWFYCRDFRIARVNDRIVSYVEYDKQKPDKFLTATFAPDLNLSPNDPANCIDDSLTFTIDGLGGGEYRSPVLNSGVAYNGRLSEFRVYTIPELPWAVSSTAVLLACTVVLLWLSRRKSAHFMCVRS